MALSSNRDNVTYQLKYPLNSFPSRLENSQARASRYTILHIFRFVSPLHPLHSTSNRASKMSYSAKPNQTHYTTLHINRDATQSEIRKAYLKLAKEDHPDKNLGNTTAATTIFNGIKDAYDVLKNEETKKRYDAELQERDQSSEPPKPYYMYEDKQSSCSPPYSPYPYSPYSNPFIYEEKHPEYPHPPPYSNPFVYEEKRYSPPYSYSPPYPYSPPYSSSPYMY